MPYKVIEKFEDLKHDRYYYEIGDSYPREGFEVDDKRLMQLSGTNNKRKTSLIEYVEEIKEV